MTPMFAGGGTTILLVLLGLLMFTFLMQRPLKKQMAAQNELRDSLTEGTRVLLTSQIIGTVTHVGDEQLIIEIAPGVEVTVMKQAVIRTIAPEDEEFEFADEDAPSDESLTPIGEPEVTMTGPVGAPSTSPAAVEQNTPESPRQN
ncbi:preprotein translocase subunit YajC [Luteococcus sp. H138]|uniref:preprotein translocase subunit YajC n=1 Tax=unclassified Luteococcus TaxID=2639923 RepID=UPI00313B3E13